MFIEIYSTGWMSSKGWIVRKSPMKLWEEVIQKSAIIDWKLEDRIFIALIILLGVAHSSILDFESDPFEAASYNTEKYRINYKFFFKSETLKVRLDKHRSEDLIKFFYGSFLISKNFGEEYDQDRYF